MSDNMKGYILLLFSLLLLLLMVQQIQSFRSNMWEHGKFEDAAWYNAHALDVNPFDCIREVQYFEELEPAKEFAASTANPFAPVALVESKFKGYFVGVYNTDDLSFNEKERLEFEYGDCLDTEKLAYTVSLDSSSGSSWVDPNYFENQDDQATEPGARDDLREKYLD